MMILGVAGGNGLEHIDVNQIRTVYGVDINEHYLHQCVMRYPHLQTIFQPVCVDLTTQISLLPPVQLLVANLLIEYIGYVSFSKIVQQVQPTYVSCIIQYDGTQGFLSTSPYQHAFDELPNIHQQIDAQKLIQTMQQMQYQMIYEDQYPLINDKQLIQIDFKKVA